MSQADARPEGGSDRTEQRSGVMGRRKLLLAGAGAAAAAASGSLLSPAGALGDGVSDLYGASVNGTLKAVLDERTVVIGNYHLSVDWEARGMPAQAGSEVTVSVADGAVLYRDSVCALSDFEPGDSVIAFVRGEGEGLVADALESTYVTVEGVVSSRSGNRLSTSAGSVVLVDETHFRYSPESRVQSADQIAGGAAIMATCRVDRSGDLVAANIGVV